MRCVGNLVVTSREPRKLNSFAKIKINNETTLAKILLAHERIIINTKDEKIKEFIEKILMKTREVMKTLLQYTDISIIVNGKEYSKDEIIKSIENMPLFFSEEKGYKYKRKKFDDILVIKRKGNEFEILYFFNSASLGIINV